MKLLVCLGLLACAPISAAASWNQWRGPLRDGSATKADWPATLDESGLHRRWAVPMGPSYSGPVMDADRVFTTETVDKSASGSRP